MSIIHIMESAVLHKYKYRDRVSMHGSHNDQQVAMITTAIIMYDNYTTISEVASDTNILCCMMCENIPWYNSNIELLPNQVVYAVYSVQGAPSFIGITYLNNTLTMMPLHTHMQSLLAAN